jgi:hypothetical protein
VNVVPAAEDSKAASPPNATLATSTGSPPRLVRTNVVSAASPSSRLPKSYDGGSITSWPAPSAGTSPSTSTVAGSVSIGSCTGSGLVLTVKSGVQAPTARAPRAGRIQRSMIHLKAPRSARVASYTRLPALVGRS